MRRSGEIMADLGFREDAPDSVKKAFVKNLIHAAYGAEVKSFSEYKDKRDLAKKSKTVENKKSFAPKQLAFDLK